MEGSHQGQTEDSVTTDTTDRDDRDLDLVRSVAARSGR